MNLVLSARLQAIADAVGRCKTVADIGTDHAFLPIYLVQNNLCEKVFAVDIAEGPLKRAEMYIKEYIGETERIVTVLSDGYDSLPEPCEVTVIAGMGGDNIGIILDRVPPEYAGRLVLQPMTSPEELRRHLYETGWQLTDETVVEDAGYLYTVMNAVRGKKTYCPYEVWFSAPLLGKHDSTTEKYLLKQLMRLQTVVDGRKRSERRLSSEAEESALNELRRVYDEQYGR